MLRPSALLLLGLAPLPLAAAAALQDRPVVLINRSASEPPGLYLLERRLAVPGAKIAFRIPQPGRAYAARVMPERLASSILKTVVAGEGDRVCASDDRLVVNGRRIAAIAEKDRRGQPLPRWRQCRRLRAGELFVFSNRIPNSFDSRYYGPVPTSDVIGVYRLLRAFEGAPGGETGP